MQQLVEKESSKPTNVEVQVAGKTNIDPVNVTTQEKDKQVAEGINLDVAVQTRNILSEGSVTNSITSSPKENKKITTHLRRESQSKKVPYLHPNHGSRQFNRAMYYEPKQADIPKNTNVGAIH